MKHIKKTTPLLLLMLSISLACMTCEKPPKFQEKAYYQFTSLDNQRLLPYTEGQVLKFMSQNNEERYFTIYSVNTQIKTQYSVGMSISGLEAGYFYYDSKEIGLIDSETKWFKIYFNRFPLDVQLAKHDDYTEYPSRFYSCINYFSPWNGMNEYGRYDGCVSIHYEQEKIEMTFNGKTYKNVFVFNSGNNSIIHERNINIIYYDEIEGIIGFDDLNGNKWRLIE